MIQHYGNLGIFLILLTEMVGVPFPAETTLTVSGFEWSQGVLHLVPLFLAAILGNIAGSSIAYGIGRFLGRPVILALGKYVGISAQKLDRAESRFQRSERWIVLLGKFIAGVRVLVPYLAGINKMNFAVFSVFNAASAMLWVLFFVTVGRYLGVTWTRYHHVLNHTVLLIVLCLLLVAIVWALVGWRRRRNR